MKRFQVLIGVLSILAIPAMALAHGGNYRAPPESAGGPSGGTDRGDRAVSVTRWETWWAKNKEYYLRLSRDLGPTAPVTHDDSVSRASREEILRRYEERLRKEARRALSARQVPLFLRALRDESAEVRSSAAIAIGRSGNSRASEALRAAAEKDRDPMVRESALLGLGLLGRTQDVFLLDEHLSDSRAPSRRRSFAALSLGLIGGEEARAMLMRFLIRTVHLGKERGRAANEVAASAVVALGMVGGDEASAFLRKALASDRYASGLRPYVILSLGRLKERDVLPQLVTLLASTAPESVRRASAVAVGKIARPTDTGAMDALLGTVEGDRDEVTRHFAAVALGGIDSEETRAQLWRMLDKGATRTRPFAALALARLGATGAAPTLRRMLAETRNDSLRSGLCISLGLLKDKESLPLLEALVAGRTGAWTKGYAALAIGMIGERRSALVLRNVLDDTDDPRLVTNIAIALGILGDRWVEDYLERRVSQRLSATTAPVAGVIGLLRLEGSVGALRRLFDSPASTDTHRAYAIVALGMIVDKDEIPRLSGLSIGHDYSLSLDPLNEVLTIL